MKWYSYRIWLPVFVICIGLLIFQGGMFHKETPIKERMKKEDVLRRPMVLPPPPVEKSINYVDIGLKIGSGLGGVMTLLNIIDKIRGWRKK